MSRMRFPFERILVATAVIAVAASSGVRRPALVCWKVETGGAASTALWVDRSNTYQGMDHDYRTSRLAADTLLPLNAFDAGPRANGRRSGARRSTPRATPRPARRSDGLVERTQPESGRRARLVRRRLTRRGEPAGPWEERARVLVAVPRGRRDSLERRPGPRTKTGYDAIAKAIELEQRRPRWSTPAPVT